MNANTFGRIFQVSTFGESHGNALGAVIQGCPAGVPFDNELLVKNLNRRRPGQSTITTARNEKDQPEILSGVYDGKTLGTPIAIIVRNEDHDSSSYTEAHLKMRKGHATDLWQSKFGHSDPRGSGRASGRETLSRVIGGSVAQMLLNVLAPDIKTSAFVSQIGSLKMDESEILEVAKSIEDQKINVDTFSTRMPLEKLDREANELLLNAKEEGESFGGMIEIFVHSTPQNLGQPVFMKLKSEFAMAMMSVGATNSFEIGFANLQRTLSGKKFHSENQSYGGLRGGISTGEDLHLRVGFKPPATLSDMAKAGRHDPCILPRAIPVLEAMANLVLADQVLLTRVDHC